MKELENVMSQLEKETKKKEQAENKIKQLCSILCLFNFSIFLF